MTNDQSRAPTARHRADTRTHGRSFGQDMTASANASRARTIATVLALSAADARFRFTWPPLAIVIAPDDAYDMECAWLATAFRRWDQGKKRRVKLRLILQGRGGPHHVQGVPAAA